MITCLFFPLSFLLHISSLQLLGTKLALLLLFVSISRLMSFFLVSFSFSSHVQLNSQIAASISDLPFTTWSKHRNVRFQFKFHKLCYLCIRTCDFCYFGLQVVIAFILLLLFLPLLFFCFYMFYINHSPSICFCFFLHVFLFQCALV